MNPSVSTVTTAIKSQPLLWALGIAVWIRLVPITLHAILVGGAIPYNLGGLFARFATEIRFHHYALPTSIPYYTIDGLPFAYPPASLYFLAFVTHVLPLAEVTAINILPTLISILAVGAFYLLVKQLPLTKTEKVIAVLAWAILPNAYKEQTEAAGIAESFGTLAIVLLMASVIYYLKNRSRWSAAVIGIVWGFAIVASPGSAIGSFVVVGIVFLSHIVTSSNIKELSTHLLWVGGILATAGALTSFYWVNVLSDHGWRIFTAPLATVVFVGDSPLADVEYITRLLLEARPLQTGGVIVPILAALGAVVILRRNHWLLPVWLITLLIIPRESFWLVAAPTAVLVGIGFSNYGLPIIRKLWKLDRPSKGAAFFSKLVVIALLAITLFGPAKQVVKQILDSRQGEDVYVTQQHFETMKWVKQNVVQGSKFIVVSNSNNVLEWFPHIAEQEVLNMPYGSEWEPDEARLMSDLIRSARNCQNIQCLQDSASRVIDDQSVFVFVDKKSKLHKQAQLSEDISLLKSTDGGLVGLLKLAP